jgi:hypothetical protein
MKPANDILQFLAAYSEPVYDAAMRLREVILKHLPGVTEQLDIPAKMIAYAYGQKYAELVCVIIPSKKGLKLGFNKGTTLSDPAGLLEGSGKISRYVIIKSGDDIKNPALIKLLQAAMQAYKERTN